MRARGNGIYKKANCTHNPWNIRTDRCWSRQKHPPGRYRYRVNLYSMERRDQLEHCRSARNDSHAMLVNPDITDMHTPRTVPSMTLQSTRTLLGIHHASTRSAVPFSPARTVVHGYRDTKHNGRVSWPRSYYTIEVLYRLIHTSRKCGETRSQ